MVNGDDLLKISRGKIDILDDLNTAYTVVEESYLWFLTGIFRLFGVSVTWISTLFFETFEDRRSTLSAQMKVIRSVSGVVDFRVTSSWLG